MEDAVYVTMYKDVDSNFQFIGSHFSKYTSDGILVEYTPQKIALNRIKPVYRFKIKEKHNV